MRMNFQRYSNLKQAIQDWLSYDGTLQSIADPLHITSSSLLEMLSWNGLADANGRPQEFITVQDVLNIILLVYCLSNRDILKKTVSHR